jgi:DNA mismatch repair protein MSH6
MTEQKAVAAGRSSKVDDDDDFIVPDDVSEGSDNDAEEDLPPSSRPASRASDHSSRASSRLSTYSHTASSETEADLPLNTTRKKPGERPPAVKKKSGSSNIFLTAAEQRTQAQKEEKKSSEDPFQFLLDVRDKDGIRPGEPGYDPRTLYIPPKAWKTFTPFEKQVCAWLHALAHHYMLMDRCCMYSSGRLSKTTLIQCYFSKRESSWSCTRRMHGLGTRSSISS